MPMCMLTTQKPAPLSDAPERSDIALVNHIIQLRQLTGEISTSVLAPSNPQAALPEADRAGFLSGIQTRLDAWYADAVQSGPNDWLKLLYHQALSQLYLPTPLYPEPTPATLTKLYASTTTVIDLYAGGIQGAFDVVLNAQAQLNAAVALLYVLAAIDARTDVVPNHWDGQLTRRMGQVQTLYRGVEPAVSGGRAKDAYETIRGVLGERYGTDERSAIEAVTLDLPQIEGSIEAGSRGDERVEKAVKGLWYASSV